MTGWTRRLGRPLKKKMLDILEVRGGVLLCAAALPRAAAYVDETRYQCLELDTFKDGLTVSAEVFARRRQQGHRCFALKDQNRIVSAGWVSEPGLVIQVIYDTTFSVPARAVYVWDCHTAPDARCRGHFKTLLRCLRGRQAPGNSVYAAVDTGNEASLRAFDHTGFKIQFRYIGCRFLGRPGRAFALKSRRLMLAQSALDDLKP